MKLSVATAILAATTGIVAKSCKNGGDYRDDIKRVLKDRGNKSPSEADINNSLFKCVEHGNIEYRKFRDTGCIGVGSSADDACL